ncbi:LytTR family DNA-binding domain-containing protein [Streptomyces sp. PTM05]|uniref:LytTR family DNA-binding domain-containing protein n=1 Tax=Streptantibioticus parmotrematis TaxID=2873249 RepID=A0ABS7QYN8_9ACTN|nr:LytTR family DNA-binding domain-containing protein [Streptantibioticus parmotrematis]MBY8888321.1 LytTR family DNA-binding domain-containing protein [Streptantibioticus parmotrematis]
MLRVLAVDDEVPALGELLYLLRADPRIARADGATDATDVLRRLGRTPGEPFGGPDPYDLTGDAGQRSCAQDGGGGAYGGGPDGPGVLDAVFLDIRLPGLGGLDLARLLGRFARPPLIVFVTAHEEFAVRAFDLEAVDYLLKPVRRERLAEAVRRVDELVHGTPVTARGAPADEVIPVELGGVTRFVRPDEVTYAQAHGDYARLHTVGGAGGHLVRVALSTLEDRWRERGFVRVHRRYLVALWAIDELRTDGGNMSVRVGRERLSVSRRHARELRDLLVRGAAHRVRGGS